RVPVAVPIGVAVLPWLVGDAGLRHSLHMVLDAFAQVDPSDKATLMAVGIAESTACRFAGALLASVLLAFVGLALALTGSTRRSRVLVAASAAPLGLAFAGACVAHVLGELMHTFKTMPMVSPIDRGVILMAAISEMKP